MKELLKEWRSQQRWFKIVPESEQFQFGNGETLQSRFHVQFETVIAGSHVVLGMSVVGGKCPPLLSRHACSQLGLKIDCGNHSFSSSRMGVRNYGLSQASNGHYILPISNFVKADVQDVPSDFRLDEGQEAWVVGKALHSMQMESDSNAAAMMPNSNNDLPTDPSSDVLLGAHVESLGIPRAEAMCDLRRSRSPSERMPSLGRVGSRGGRRAGDGGRRGLPRLGEESEYPEDHTQEAGPSQGDPELRVGGPDLHRDAFTFGMVGGGGSPGVDSGGDQFDHQTSPTTSTEPEQERRPEGLVAWHPRAPTVLRSPWHRVDPATEGCASIVRPVSSPLRLALEAATPTSSTATPSSLML